MTAIEEDDDVMAEGTRTNPSTPLKATPILPMTPEPIDRALPAEEADPIAEEVMVNATVAAPTEETLLAEAQSPLPSRSEETSSLETRLEEEEPTAETMSPSSEARLKRKTSSPEAMTEKIPSNDAVPEMTDASNAAPLSEQPSDRMEEEDASKEAWPEKEASPSDMEDATDHVSGTSTPVNRGATSLRDAADLFGDFSEDEEEMKQDAPPEEGKALPEVVKDMAPAAKPKKPKPLTEKERLKMKLETERLRRANAPSLIIRNQKKKSLTDFISRVQTLDDPLRSKKVVVKEEKKESTTSDQFVNNTEVKAARAALEKNSLKMSRAEVAQLEAGGLQLDQKALADEEGRRRLLTTLEESWQDFEIDLEDADPTMMMRLPSGHLLPIYNGTTHRPSVAAAKQAGPPPKKYTQFIAEEKRRALQRKTATITAAPQQAKAASKETEEDGFESDEYMDALGEAAGTAEASEEEEEEEGNLMPSAEASQEAPEEATAPPTQSPPSSPQREGRTMAEYFANKQKQKMGASQPHDLLYSDDLGALLSGAPPPVAGPPPPVEGEAEPEGLFPADAGFFLSHQPAKSEGSDVWGNLREKEGVQSHLATPAMLTQGPLPPGPMPLSPVRHPAKINTMPAEKAPSTVEDDISPDLESPPHIRLPVQSTEEEDDEHLQRLYGDEEEEETPSKEALPDQPTAMQGYFSIFQQAKKTERVGDVSEKPAINLRNQFVEDEADIEEDEFMHEGGREGDLAPNEGNEMEAESGDEDVIEHFDDIKARFREEEQASHRKGVTDLINDLAEPGGLERKRRARRRNMADKYGDEFEDWDSDDEFAYWRRKRQNKAGDRAAAEFLSGEYDAAPETRAFARAFYADRRAINEEDLEEDVHVTSFAQLEEGEENNLSRSEWTRMIEKENSRLGFLDEDSQGFLASLQPSTQGEKKNEEEEEADLELPAGPATSTIAAVRKRSTLLSRTTSFAGLANQSIVVATSKEDAARKAVLRKGMVFKTSEVSNRPISTSRTNSTVSMSAALSQVLPPPQRKSESIRKSVDFGHLHKK